VETAADMMVVMEEKPTHEVIAINGIWNGHRTSASANLGRRCETRG
jgi:hypothetical protein